MAFVITQLCVGAKHAACLPVCPCDTIHPTSDEPGFAEAEQLYIDADHCIHCGLCAGECPAKAIFADEDVPPEFADAPAINAAYFKTT
jgi:NAD-dependent dihydropyrimidine dehydrogenase PreA subunit